MKTIDGEKNKISELLVLANKLVGKRKKTAILNEIEFHKQCALVLECGVRMDYLQKELERTEAFIQKIKLRFDEWEATQRALGAKKNNDCSV